MNPYYHDEESGITIYHGNCREVLPTLPKADLVLMDPPYGINTGRTSVGSGGGEWGEQAWDASTVPQQLIDACIGQAPLAIVWGGNYYAMPPSRCWLAWDKKQPMGWYSTAHFELAWTNFDRNAHAFRMSQVEAYGGMNKRHPSQKPLSLLKWCIAEADAACRKECGLVIDPFMGSGTTLRAAKDLGRRAIGIELSEAYCEIAANRLSQGVLFGPEETK